MESDETETLTIRLPRGLKVLVEQTAKLRSTTVTNVVRESLQDVVLKPAAVQTPGLTSEFQRFLDENNRHGQPPVLILREDLRGDRYCFEGRIDPNLTNQSVLTISSRNSQTDWVIPRNQIVGWFGGTDTERAHLDKFAGILQRNGWAFP